MKRIVIAGRHGNTFDVGDTVVMVGASQDLPLTDRGRQQARAVADALTPYRAEINLVLAGPLKRTREFAELVIEVASIKARLTLDPRLRELDYGAWGGLSDEQIIALSGSSAALDAWRERGERPHGVQFTPSQQQAEREMEALLEELAQHDGISVVITSNGRLRETGQFISHNGQTSWKVGTGRLCVFEYLNGTWKIVAWDIAPERLAEVL